jgi:hypothetical protein
VSCQCPADVRDRITRIFARACHVYLSPRKFCFERSAMSVEMASATAYLDNQRAGEMVSERAGLRCIRRLSAGIRLGRYRGHPLRTLDALHLSVAHYLGPQSLATADAVMAGAARAMGFYLDHF